MNSIVCIINQWKDRFYAHLRLWINYFTDFTDITTPYTHHKRFSIKYPYSLRNNRQQKKNHTEIISADTAYVRNCKLS